MDKLSRYTDYEDFAWLYNQYWSKRLIDQIWGTIEDHLIAKIVPGGRVLDVACGNGHLAGLLLERGFRVTGIDGSEAMLRFARENAPGGEFHVADAWEFRYDETFDAATSTCDSLNHVMSLEELGIVFANVYNALVPGGWFLFDLNTEKGYGDYWNGHSGGRALADHAFIVQLGYEQDTRQGTFAVTLFRQAGDTWRRTDVKLLQQYHAPDAVRDSLERTGFDAIEFYDVERDLGIAGTGRMMFVTRKPTGARSVT